MSITIETTLSCDGPCGQIFTKGLWRTLPARKQRASAAANEGWITRRSKDYCKDCAKKLGIHKRITYGR
jgi:hypothetical protein